MCMAPYLITTAAHSPSNKDYFACFAFLPLSVGCHQGCNILAIIRRLDCNKRSSRFLLVVKFRSTLMFLNPTEILHFLTLFMNPLSKTKCKICFVMTSFHMSNSPLLFFSGLCPDWDQWDQTKPVDNAREAMQQADDWLGIPQVKSNNVLIGLLILYDSAHCFLLMMSIFKRGIINIKFWSCGYIRL